MNSNRMNNLNGRWNIPIICLKSSVKIAKNVIKTQKTPKNHNVIYNISIDF